jgi:putative transposase
MCNETREAKNKQIAQTMRTTFEKRSRQVCRVYTVKIQENKLSKLQQEQLKMMFIEAKWLKNAILAWTKQNPENKVWKYDTKQKTVIHKDKDMKDVEAQLKYIPAQVKQCVQSEMIANIRTIITLQKKGLQHGGHLKFVKKVSALNLKQYGSSHKLLSSKRIKIAGVSGSILVNGLDQFINIPFLEYANAKLLNTPSGYYVQFTTYLDKDKVEHKKNNGETIGIDFGCQTSFTLSNGEKINVQVQENERIKRLSQKLNRRQKKGSKNWYKTVRLIQKQYQKQTNQKNDKANKIVAKLNEFEKIIIQDEQLPNWHRGGHGKAVQHSILGRVKSKLKQLPKTVVLDKSIPTTKLCSQCGEFHDEMNVWNRTFKCDCGVEMDRDIHAAKNMVWFYENNVGVGRTNVKRVEMKALVGSALKCSSL